MKLIFTTFVITVFCLVSCGRSFSVRQTSPRTNADLSTPLELRVHLSPRDTLTSSTGQAHQLINTYYVQLSPEGDNCSLSSNTEQIGAYEDGLVLSFALDRNCDYTFELLAGHRDQNLALQTSLATFDQLVGPIMQRNCVSCHLEYTSYEAVAAIKDNVMVQVSSGAMPPEQSLSDYDLASFFAWEADGFLETDPSPIPEDSPRLELSSVYYRNNYNYKIAASTLTKRQFLYFEDALWLQEDGENEGFESLSYEFGPPQGD